MFVWRRLSNRRHVLPKKQQGPIGEGDVVGQRKSNCDENTAKLRDNGHARYKQIAIALGSGTAPQTEHRKKHCRRIGRLYIFRAGQ